MTAPSTMTLGGAIALTLAGGCDAGPPAGRPGSVHPNVLVVTLDTLRADVLSPYGGPPDLTPTLTRLAGESARATRAYTVTPLTIPAHSSLFTGVVPPRHGVRDNGDYFLGEGVTTLAERFRDAGYATMAAVGAEVTSHHWGFDQGFDAYFDDMGERTDANRWRVERRGDAVLADAMPWLAAHAGKEQPIFAWVHLFDAHHPYVPPKEYAAKAAGRPYLGEVAWLDHLVGTLLDGLGPTLDRTWLFVLGDHGEGLGAHGEAMHGMQLYNATTRIPLFVRPPGGLGAERVLDFPVSIVDVAPTALAAAGLAVPDGLDGADLGPWIAGAADPPERSVYIESLYGWHHYGFAPQRALAGPHYKLIDNLHPELYQADDLPELEDVAPIREAQVATLQEKLDTWSAAMVPLEDASARATLDAEQMAQLEALGYVASAGPEADGPVPFRTDLPDPAAHRAMLAEIETARQALQSGDLDSALAQVQHLAERYPDLLAPRQLLASVHLRRGEIDDALAVLASLDASRPSSDTKAMMGVAHLSKGDPAGAIALFQAAVETDPYLARAWVPLLHARVFTGDLDGLTRDAAAAMDKLPEVPGVFGMYGLSLAMSGDLARGEPLVRRATDLDPRLPFMQHGLCVLHRLRNEVEEAETHCLAEVRGHPPAVPSRRILAEIYASQKRYHEQFDQIDAIRRAEPPNPITAHALAQVLFNLDRFDEALAEARACEAMDPAHPYCKLLEANALSALGREPEATAAFERAKELKQAADARAATATP